MALYKALNTSLLSHYIYSKRFDLDFCKTKGQTTLHALHCIGLLGQIEDEGQKVEAPDMTIIRLQTHHTNLLFYYERESWTYFNEW